MNTEITNEFLAACFAAYWGCKMKIADYPHEYDMCMLNGNSVCVGQNVKDVDLWYKINTCKLILTPLSLITDEDAIEVAKIGKIPETIEQGRKLAMGRFLGSICEMAHVINYLRSKSYMIPFRGVDLFTAGIAITKP